MERSVDRVHCNDGNGPFSGNNRYPRSYDLDYTSGQTVSVTLDITIPGDMTLSSIIVKEILPEGWTFVSSQPVASATTSDTREYKMAGLRTQHRQPANSIYRDGAGAGCV